MLKSFFDCILGSDEMVHKWREEQTPLFLNLYEKYECLWNNKSNNYKNKSLRDDALRAFCRDLNIPGLTTNDIKLKIKTIRTRYMVELHKVVRSEKSSAGPDDVYIPNLFWFAQANSFLRNVSIVRENLGENRSTLLDYPELLTIQKNGSENIVNGTKYFNNEVAEDIFLDELDEEGIKIEVKAEKEYDSNVINDNDSKISISTTQTKQGKKRSYLSELLSFEEPSNKSQRKLDDIQDDENEFDFFCKSLAIQLKKMPLHRALLCQEKLQSVMTQERLSQMVQDQSLTSQSHYNSNSPSLLSTDFHV